jgi:hypothetical protein
MRSLKESRRTIEALTAEKDHYKEFWLVTNNYHSVMSRFQVPAPTAGGHFTTQLHYSPPALPLFNTSPYPVSGYPLYASTSSNLTVTSTQLPSSQQDEQSQDKPIQEPHVSDSIIVPEVISAKENPTLSTLNSTQRSPETFCKRIIASYFATVKKPVPSNANDDTARVSRSSEIDSSASHDAETEAVLSSSSLPSRSQENMSTSPEDVTVSSTGKELSEALVVSDMN